MTDVTTEQFLSDVWGPEDNTVYIATKQSEGNFKVSSPVIWPAHKELILGATIQSNANWDTYYTPGTFQPGTTAKEKEFGLRAKCLWVDIDGYKDTMTNVATALQMLIEIGWLPMPTYRVSTSPQGEHWYWILEDYADAATVNDLNRRLVYFLNGDKACWDISHVMRPPNTHNHKDEYKVDGRSPEVMITHYTGDFHSVGIFDKLPKVKEALVEGIELGQNLPSLEDVMMKYQWTKDARETFHREKEHFWDESKNDYVGRGNAMVNLGYCAAEVGMPDEAIYTVLLDADERWGKFKDRANRTKQLANIIVRVRTKYPSSTFTKYVSSEESVMKPYYTFKDFMAAEFKFNWIYQNVIAEQSINFISARPGAGKSRFILQLSRSLALGKDFLGWKIVGKPRKVLVLSLEMGAPMLKKFMGHIEEESTEEEVNLFSDNFVVVPAGEPLAIATPEGEQFFNMVMGEVKPDVVMIDAMGSLDFEELSEKTSKKIMNTLKGYLNSHNVTFYVVHHNKKADAASINKPPTLNDFYGNTYAATDAANITALWKNPASSVELTELHTLKSRIGVEPVPIVLDSHSNFMFSIAGEETPYVARDTSRRNEAPAKERTESQPAAEFSAFG